MAVMVAVFPAVSATFGLKSGLDFCELRAEVAEHVLDYMVGPNAENLVQNFSRQMPVSEVPSKTHKLAWIFVPNFDNVLRCGLNHQPPPIVKLQAISMSHCNGFRKIEKDIFALVRSQANAAAMARVKIKRQSACNVFLRPMAGWAMNRSGMHDPSQYMK
jgi:hypothetical protein